ncbi:protease complex subunit PrcB family protein [bacterium]|nr:protease complex subunit PrcB family protein [bacterium]
MDKKILIRGVVPVVIVVAIALNVEECCTLSKEKQEVKKTVGVEKEWKGYHCGYTKAARLVIKTEDRWKEVWRKMHLLRLPKPAVPKIDFRKEMVIAVFMRERKSGGYKIEIREIIKTEKEIVVEVEEKEPSPESLQSMALTQPYHIVVVKSSPLPIRFQHP